MKEKKCGTCKEYKAVNAATFYRNKSSKDGFQSICKVCCKEYKKNLRDKIIIERMYKKEREELDKKINQKNLGVFKQGVKYKVVEMTGDKRKKMRHTKEFIGEIIYQDRRLLTLKNDIGIVETFLKTDFITRDYTCEQVM